MEKGEKAERFFREFVCETLKTEHELAVEDLIDAAKNDLYRVKKITISQKALFGYYKAMRNPLNGTLMEFDGKDGEPWVRARK